MATSDTVSGTQLIRCSGKAYGQIVASAEGYEVVFGNGQRAPLVYPEALEAELRESLGRNVVLTGIDIFQRSELRTVEFIVQSVFRRPPFDAAKFRERMDELARKYGPLFADVDPLKFGREDDE